jgi:hypothetical protein
LGFIELLFQYACAIFLVIDPLIVLTFVGVKSVALGQQPVLVVGLLVGAVFYLASVAAAVYGLWRRKPGWLVPVLVTGVGLSPPSPLSTLQTTN